jgi:membrane protein YqaA with SNARE-associated domain
MFESLIELGVLGLFIATFVSASIVPMPSEPFIIGAAVVLGPVITFIVSLIGGVLGAITNYYIGLKGIHKFVERNVKNEKKAQKWFDRWGAPILLAAPWIPFIGDPLIIVAGTLEMPFKKFLVYNSVARAIKNALLVWLGAAILPILHSIFLI